MSALLALAAAPSLVGFWAFVERPQRDAAPAIERPCDTDDGIRYLPNGRFRTMDEEGRWQVRGDRLTERVTHRDGARVQAPATTLRLRWYSRDHLDLDGGRRRQGLMRCG